MLLQHNSTRPHTAYQCIVGAWHIFEALKDILSGKAIEEEQYVFLQWLDVQSEDFIFCELLRLSELLEEWC
jgi:hypothetical protein